MSIAYIVSLVLSLLWVGGIFAAPLLNYMGNDTSFVYFIYSNVCHQDPARSFFIMGRKLAVCSRCTGIYIGAFAFLILYPIWKPKLNLKNVIIFSSPIFLGKLIENLLGFSSNIERFFTGFPFGFLLGMGFLYGFSSLAGEENEG